MEIETVRLHPEYRNDGKYQFLVGWTAGGAEMYRHLTLEQLTTQLTAELGSGRLVDDGTYLIWMQPEETALPILAEKLIGTVFGDSEEPKLTLLAASILRISQRIEELIERHSLVMAALLTEGSQPKHEDQNQR
jgi:hypothetical protein